MMYNFDKIESLVAENIKLVEYIARRFDNIDRNDAISEGNFALFEAAKRFTEKEMEGNFKGYAGYAIRNALIDLAKKNARERALSLDATYGDSEDDSNNSLLDYLACSDELELINVLDMLRDFYTNHCNFTEQHIIAAKLSIHRKGETVNQTQLCKIIAENFNDSRQQAGLCKRMKKLNSKFDNYVQTCERGDIA